MVVNDLGASMRGEGTDAAVAAAVVSEIVDAGGAAVADGSDVSTPEGGRTVVESALEHFGRVDVLVNNAGIIRWAGFPKADADNLARHLAVHVGGSFHTAAAAWPHMAAQAYGRIVMTTSSGLFGLPDNLGYATAKGAVVGMARSLATAGAAHGIKVNLIAPAAFTRMAGEPEGEVGRGADPMAKRLSADLVAPMVAVLAHESCPVNGEIYAAGAGRFARIFLASTPGYVAPTTSVTPEDVAEHWEAVNDEEGYQVPSDLPGWSAAFLSHLPPGQGPGAAPAAGAGA